jgi:ribonuclease D
MREAPDDALPPPPPAPPPGRGRGGGGGGAPPPPDAEAALAALIGADTLGFDTESKPTFQKGEVSTGPHLVQLADDDHAWLFQIATPRARADGATAPAAAPASAPAPGTPAPGIAVLRAVLESTAILKVGFGLGDDLRRLHTKLGIDTRNVLDLSTALRRGERNAWGAKTAVERFFGQRLQKSRKITTTNWALPRLSDKQILYAADDAHVALRIYRHWRAQPPAPAAQPAPARAASKPAPED